MESASPGKWFLAKGNFTECFALACDRNNGECTNGSDGSEIRTSPEKR